MLRQIKSKQEIEKKSKRNQLIVGSILIGLMILSTAGYSFLDSGDSGADKKSEYRGLKFNLVNGLWQTEMQGISFKFQYLPQDVENISVIGNFSMQNYINNVLYVVNNNQGFQDIYINLEQYILRTQPACLNNSNCTEFPVKTCDENIIVFKESNETSVSQDNKCILINGDGFRGADAYMYHLLGII
mgnify:CR=1 FL=1